MSLRPIETLPSEVIRMIVEGPRPRHQIMYLSHVSHLWRDVVLGMISALFIQANWQQWPTWLVDASSRASPACCIPKEAHPCFAGWIVRLGGSCRVFLEKFATQVRTLKIVYAMRAPNEAL